MAWCRSAVTQARRAARRGPAIALASVQRCAALMLAAVGSALLPCAATAQPNPYYTVADWLQPADEPLGNASAVYPDARGNVWIAERCGDNSCLGRDDIAPIRLYAASGRLLTSIGAGLFAWPHGLFVDAEGNVWVADGRGGEGKGHRIVKLDPTGAVLMTLGVAGHAGSGPGEFDGPTAVLVAPNGDIFVADGHEPEANNRIVKFTSDGNYLLEFGGGGSEPGQFRVPHALAMDSAGRLLVADRDNNRVQVFTQDGVFLDQWTQFGRPSGLYVDARDMLYVADNQSNAVRNPGWQRGIRIGSVRDGVVLAFVPDPAFDPANDEETGAHGLAADGFGNVYGAEVWTRRVVKYVGH